MLSRDDRLRVHFGRIWPVHVQEFAELLIALRRQFRGDLDLMLVLAVIGSRTLPARRLQGLSYQEFADGAVGKRDERPRPINIKSVAECSGIPRETVRRKVRTLESMGWVERSENGSLVVSERARGELAPATEATLGYLSAIGSAVLDTMNESK